MKTHLALLRGINVSGHSMIKMDALKLALERIGFKNVKTYIQSGNVFVDSEEENGPSVGFIIKQEIFKVFGHEVPVVVIGKADLEACLKNNPYLKVPFHPSDCFHISEVRINVPKLQFKRLLTNFSPVSENRIIRNIYLCPNFKQESKSAIFVSNLKRLRENNGRNRISSHITYPIAIQ